MEVALTIARLFLAMVFGVAGIAKAADPAGSRRALTGFGVPERMAAPLGTVLPLFEILIALALLPLTTAWWGAVGALALLLVFTAVIGLTLARGRAPDCHCFGQLHSEPVGWSTFGRNLGIAAIAGFVVFGGSVSAGLSALNWVTELSAPEAANLLIGLSAATLFAVVIAFLKRLLAQQNKLVGEIEAIKAALNEDGELSLIARNEAVAPTEGLPIGSIAPRFTLATVEGDEMSLDDLLEQGKAVLLMFAGPNCWNCKTLLPMVRLWQRDYADLLNIAVLTTGTLKQNHAMKVRYEFDRLLIDNNSAIANDYQAKWTPAAVLIRADGRIASHVFYGDSSIREWVRDFVTSGQLESGPVSGIGASVYRPQISVNYSVRDLGELPPKFSLPDLSGRIVDVQGLRGSPTVLLFWHPQCEFCKSIFDELRIWEEYPPESVPNLIFIASGEVEDIRKANKEFRSPTLLDPAFDVGPLFGVGFTPSAIMLDSEGRIASSLAVGDQNVRALLGLKKMELQEARSI